MANPVYNLSAAVGTATQFTDKTSGDAIIAAYPGRFSYQPTFSTSGDPTYTLLDFVNDDGLVQSVFLNDYVVGYAEAPDTVTPHLAIWAPAAFALFWTARS